MYRDKSSAEQYSILGESVAPTEAIPDKKKLVQLEKIATYDRSLQVRGGLDQEKVERYRQIMRDNGEDGAAGVMDPIMVFCEGDDGPRWIADGFHRIAAAEAEGVEKIPVILRDGTRLKALRFALGENGHHGAPMSNAEKRHAAGMAVLDPDLGKKTDKEISRLVGCSPSLVSDCRRGETPEVKAEKRTRKQREPKPTPAPTLDAAPSTAPAPARTPLAAERPTKAKLLKQIREWIDLDMVDEADVVGLFDTETAAYYFIGRPGTVVPLKIVGRSGRAQTETEVVIKSVAVDGVVLRFEGEGKIVVQEA